MVVLFGRTRRYNTNHFLPYPYLSAFAFTRRRSCACARLHAWWFHAPAPCPCTTAHNHASHARVRASSSSSNACTRRLASTRTPFPPLVFFSLRFQKIAARAIPSCVSPLVTVRCIPPLCLINGETIL